MSTSLALARPSRQSPLCLAHSHTRSTATTLERPGNTSQCHVQPLLCYHDDKILVWYPPPPVFDGASVPWALTGTHQRDSPSRQDDGVIRAPTICGWCCHGCHVVSESSHALLSNGVQASIFDIPAELVVLHGVSSGGKTLGLA